MRRVEGGGAAGQRTGTGFQNASQHPEGAREEVDPMFTVCDLRWRVEPATRLAQACQAMHTGKRGSGLLGWWYAVMDGAVAVAEHAAPARGSTPDASRDGGHSMRKEARWRLVASAAASAAPPAGRTVSALRFLPPRPLELEQRFQASHCGPPDSQALASHGVGGGGSLGRVSQ